MASLLSLLPFSLATSLGYIIHLYLLFDAFLYKEMKLRLQFRHCLYLRDIRHWVQSAREMGLYRFLSLAILLLLIHTSTYSYYKDAAPLHWAYIPTLSILALGSLFLIPKEAQYALNHPFFLKQWTSLQKRPSSLKTLVQIGPKLFDLKIEPTETPHIVILFLESFAAKYVGPEITPQFNHWMKQGVFFPHFYSNGTLTYRALLSGLFGAPPGNTASGLSPYLHIPFKGIPHFLKKKGYQTAFHHNGSLHYDKQKQFLQTHFDFIADKDAIQDSSSVGWGIDDETLMRYSANWLEEQKEPTFLTLFTISNHHPWIVPPHYKAPLLPRFLQTTHYSDYAFGCLIDYLQQKQLTKKTILFILGDHGQPMGEHQGNFYNSRFLYEENVRIPLLILAEGRISQPTVIQQVGSQIDLLPTILDLLQIRQPCWGTSLLRETPEKIVYLQNPYSEGFFGCRQGPWKWIQNCFSSKMELYNLEEDPQEEKNIVLSHPKLAETLHRQTQSFFSAIENQYQGKSLESISPYCLDLSHSMIRDRELERAASPHLLRVNLADCLLVTDQGISAFCAKCPSLEELHLKGITDLTHHAFRAPLSRLRVLDISDAREIDVEKIEIFFPHLQELSMNGKSTLSISFGHLIRLKLYEAERMNDEILIHLLEKNPHLGRLAIYDAKQITDRALAACKNHPLEMLWLYDAPHLTDIGISHLSCLPIRSIALEGAPLLTLKSLPFLEKMESLHLRNCPGISAKDLLK